MDIKKHDKVTIEVELDVISIGEDRFNLPEDIYELIEMIDGTQYGFNHVVINDYNLEKLFIKHNILEKSNKGSCYKGDNFDEFKQWCYDNIFI